MRQVRIRWPANSNTRPELVNQFAFTPGHVVGPEGLDEGTFYLLFGHVAPPLIFSPADFAEAPTEMWIEPRAQLVMGRERAVELWRILGATLGLLPPRDERGATQ